MSQCYDVINSLTVYQAIFTGQQLCLDAFATPCRPQQNHSRSVRGMVSVFHLQVGQYYNKRIITAVNSLHSSRTLAHAIKTSHLVIESWRTLRQCWFCCGSRCTTGLTFTQENIIDHLPCLRCGRTKRILSSENDGLSTHKVPCIKKRTWPKKSSTSTTIELPLLVTRD